MGDSPTPPPVPNPYQVSQAQTGTNINSALASSALSNSNVVGPYGSTTYSTQPSGTNVEGINIPQYTQTTVLSPEQQQMLNLRNQTGVGLNQLALDETGTISNLLRNQDIGQGLLGLGGLPVQGDLQGLPNGPSMQVPTLQYMDNSTPSVSYGFDPRGNIQNSIGPTNYEQSRPGRPRKFSRKPGLYQGHCVFQ